MAGRVAPFIDNTGLVFAYDQANIVRSYLGEPTVNIATNTPSLGGWPGSYTVVDSDTKTFDFTTSTVEWGGDASWTTFYYNVSAYTGQYVTISATFEYASDPNKFNFLWIGQTSGSETYLGYSSEADRNQKSTDDREDISWSGVIGSGGKVGILIWMSNGNSTTVTARISNIQVEVKSHKTPFTTGTRSVTQGLKDLTGRSTIDLTNVSFDSNAQMTFDGTDDYATVSGSAVTALTGDMTLNAWYYYNGSTAAPHRTLICTDQTYQYGAKLMTYYHGQRAMWVGSSDGASNYLVAGGAAPTNQWRMLTGTRSTDGTVKLYDNGELIANEQTGKTGTFARAGVVMIGGEYHSKYLGEIPLTQLYNRVLSASEIQQNFNAIKGRYGL